jgi:hypothetical protein
MMSNVEKMSYSQVREELTKLIDGSVDKNQSYIPATLFLRGLAAELIAHLPADQQQVYINAIRSQVDYI